MSLPTSEPLPFEPESSLPPVHRRRKRRSVFSLQTGDHAGRLEELAHRLIPSLDFFIFALFAGLVLGAAILLDAPALYVLAALLAPFMAPLIGISLAAIVGSFTFFIQSLGGFLVGSLLVFGCGSLAGWISQVMPAQTFHQAAFHASFSWADLAVLVLGACLSAYQIARAPTQRPLVASVAMAYELYLPLGVAGFGLVQGNQQLWPGALSLFLLYTVIAALVGVILLTLLGFRLINFFAYAVVLVLILTGAAVIFFQQGYRLPAIPVPPASFTSAPKPGITRTITPSPLEALFVTWTPAPPTNVFTPTKSLVPTRTATETVSPMPTPIWAKVNAKDNSGIVFRDQAGFNGKIMGSLLNGNLVEVLSDSVTVDNSIWIHIRTVDGREGWVQRILLVTATPMPGW